MAKKKTKVKKRMTMKTKTTTSEKKIPANPVKAGENLAERVSKKFGWDW